MSGMSEEPADRLRKARVARGFASAAEAARAHGWSEVTYTSHENGTRGIRADAAKRYAAAFGIKASSLLGIIAESEVQPILVSAMAEFGVWRDQALDSERSRNRKSFFAVAAGGTNMAFAWEVADNSADVAVGRGEYAICVPFDGTAASGAIVAVERVRDGLVERTLRRVVTIHNGEITLEPCSTDRRYAGRVVAKAAAAADGEVRIVGRVVGKYADIS